MDDGQLSRHRQHRAFACSVGQLGGCTSHQCDDTGSVDDASMLLAVFAQADNCMLTPVPHSFDIYIVSHVPDFLRRIDGIRIISMHDACIIENDITSAPGVLRLYHSLNVGLLGHIAPDRFDLDGVGRHLFYLRKCFFKGGLRDVSHKNGGAFTGEEDGSFEPNAARYGPVSMCSGLHRQIPKVKALTPQRRESCPQVPPPPKVGCWPGMDSRTTGYRKQTYKPGTESRMGLRQSMAFTCSLQGMWERLAQWPRNKQRRRGFAHRGEIFGLWQCRYVVAPTWGSTAIRRNIGFPSSNALSVPPPQVEMAETDVSLFNLTTVLEQDTQVKLAGIDADGILRGKLVSKRKFLSIAQNGFGFCSVIFGWDMHDQTYFKELGISNKENGYRDMLAIPDLSSFRRIPWEDNVAFFLINFFDPETKAPISACPRGLLRVAAEKMEKIGYRAMAGAEYEFYQFRAPPNPNTVERNSSSTATFLRENPVNSLPPLTEGMFGYSLTRTVHNQEYYYRIFNTCREFKCNIESWHTESGPGVFEAALEFGEIKEIADRASLFK
ncbi:glutamine synthetase [Histoplasma capsulatum H143]|uniref:Glutamine synthetase n=1 Tax=Ajellomyces capsulatus (strain H143) TaxID=544712 RepID=C6H653_AJECH|nr:glutamine synthetase [Histoplasma capsulatum H143]